MLTGICFSSKASSYPSNYGTEDTRIPVGKVGVVSCKVLSYSSPEHKSFLAIEDLRSKRSVLYLKSWVRLLRDYDIQWDHFEPDSRLPWLEAHACHRQGFAGHECHERMHSEDHFSHNSHASLYHIHRFQSCNTSSDIAFPCLPLFDANMDTCFGQQIRLILLCKNHRHRFRAHAGTQQIVSEICLESEARISNVPSSSETLSITKSGIREFLCWETIQENALCKYYQRIASFEIVAAQWWLGWC